MGRTEDASSRKKSGAAGILIWLILIALMIYAAATLCQLQERIAAAESQEAAVAAQVEELRGENESLRSDIASAGDPEKLEEVARNELGMVKNGEKVFYDTNY